MLLIGCLAPLKYSGAYMIPEPINSCTPGAEQPELSRLMGRCLRRADPRHVHPSPACHGCLGRS